MKLRKLIDDPSIAKSSMLTVDPSRDIPYTDKLLPRRRKLRTDSALPKLMKSSTLSELPRRAIP
jgi:hypothetical protein